MVNIKMEFKHPKYYTELRRAGVQVNSSRPAHSRCNKSDQVISANKLDGDMKVRAPGPGQELGQVQPCDREATPSSKPQATSDKPQATSSQASSDKHQAPSYKRQASSRKRQVL